MTKLSLCAIAALSMSIVLLSNRPDVQNAVHANVAGTVQQLFNQARFIGIAAADEGDNVATDVADKTARQAVLAKLAINSESADIRKRAILGLKDKSVLSLAATSDDPELLNSIAILEMVFTACDKVLEKPRDRCLPSVLDLVRVLSREPVSTEMELFWIQSIWESIFEEYSAGTRSFSIEGERVTFYLRFIHNEKKGVDVTHISETNFPWTASENTKIITAEIALNELLERVFASLSQPTLAVLAADNSDTDVRDAAIANMVDQAMLAKLALESLNVDVRIATVKKLSDQVMLAKVASESTDVDVRLAAVKKITNQAALANIAAKDRSIDVRNAAIARMPDWQAASKIGPQDNDADLRVANVEKLTDQAALATIAISDKNWRVRFAAVGKLIDQTTLTTIASNEADVDVRLAAVKKLTNQRTLVRIALEDTERLVRASAVNNIIDQAALLKIASESPYNNLRLAAVRKLTDQATLEKLALGDYKLKVRLAAVRNITDLGILTRLVTADVPEEVREAAFAKIERGD